MKDKNAEEDIEMTTQGDQESFETYEMIHDMWLERELKIIRVDAGTILKVYTTVETDDQILGKTEEGVVPLYDKQTQTQFAEKRPLLENSVMESVAFVFKKF